jgi:hypothetical protein
MEDGATLVDLPQETQHEKDGSVHVDLQATTIVDKRLQAAHVGFPALHITHAHLYTDLD